MRAAPKYEPWLFRALQNTPRLPLVSPKGTGGIRNLIYLAQPPLFTQGTAVIKLADLMTDIVNDNRSHEASPSILERDWWPVKDPIYVFSVVMFDQIVVIDSSKMGSIAIEPFLD